MSTDSRDDVAGLPLHLRIALRVSEQLSAVGIAHMVCGSVASSIHGEPRTTYDIDMVVELSAQQVDLICRALDADFHADPEAVRLAIETRTGCNVIHKDTAFKVDLLMLKNRPYSRVEFERKIDEPLLSKGGPALPIATPEDIVLTKLEWYSKGGEVSDRQWRDVMGILRTKQSGLDRAYIDHWSRELGLDDLWERAIAATR